MLMFSSISNLRVFMCVFLSVIILRYSRNDLDLPFDFIFPFPNYFHLICLQHDDRRFWQP